MPPQQNEGLTVSAATTEKAETKTPYLANASPSSSSFTSGSVTATCSVIEFGKSFHSTGICFLDHMVDQLTSHAQIGVTMRVSIDGVLHQAHIDYASGSLADRPHDRDIFIACGAALGSSLKYLVNNISESVFCCPLDEAFAEARLTLSSDAPYSLCDLAPYGSMPRQGRRWIGCYQCALTPVFFEHLVQTLGARLELRKMRGHNAHHVVESSFKAFARVFRACLDGSSMGGSHGCVIIGEERVRQDLLATPNHRTGSRSRSTKETTIKIHADLDCPAPTALTESIFTGVELMDIILGEFRQTAGFNFSVHCDGDIYIDDHHTVEDVAITLGQCLNVALGNKAGLARKIFFPCN
uniref:Imidazoleglycerol-phosphate dehydratase n=1 Tax=Corethron hystrix TaxID=216773 RepID=A0A7S1B9G5_9STRA|mmetsp:Transcript_18123/g.41276  ORF Transcript_18123/g.41276 Transcript_18123/m.41276 type:complete len:354 (+) Transcript_18123:106-1167(+)